MHIFIYGWSCIHDCWAVLNWIQSCREVLSFLHTKTSESRSSHRPPYSFPLLNPPTQKVFRFLRFCCPDGKMQSSISVRFSMFSTCDSTWINGNGLTPPPFLLPLLSFCKTAFLLLPLLHNRNIVLLSEWAEEVSVIFTWELEQMEKRYVQGKTQDCGFTGRRWNPRDL